MKRIVYFFSIFDFSLHAQKKSTYVIRLNNDFFQTATNAAQPFYNMWDASRTNTENRNSPIKSIYDPCPPGYSVPLKDAFTAFSANKVTSTSTNLLFKKTSADGNPSIWPMLGYRYQTTAVYYNAWAYWTSCPLSQDKAHRPDIRSDVVYYSKETNRYETRPGKPTISIVG